MGAEFESEGEVNREMIGRCSDSEVSVWVLCDSFRHFCVLCWITRTMIPELEGTDLECLTCDDLRYTKIYALVKLQYCYLIYEILPGREISFRKAIQTKR